MYQCYLCQTQIKIGESRRKLIYFGETECICLEGVILSTIVLAIKTETSCTIDLSYNEEVTQQQNELEK